MIETMLIAQGVHRRIVSGPPVIDTFAVPPRSNCAFGEQNGIMMMFGGQMGPPNPYPNYGHIINLATGVATQITGYHGTWSSGTVQGNKLVIAQGHDGKSNNTLYTRPFPSAIPPTGPMAVTGAPARTAPVLTAIDANRVYYGMGYATGWAPDLYIYDLSIGAVERLPDAIDVSVGISDGKASEIGSDGRLYVMPWSSDFQFLRVYDPVKRKWSYSSSMIAYPDFFKGGSSAVRINNHIYFFGGGLDNTKSFETGNFLRCLRYDVDANIFDMIEFKGIPALYCSSFGFSADKTKLYVVSGTLPNVNNISNRDMIPRSTNAYSFSVAALEAA